MKKFSICMSLLLTSALLISGCAKQHAEISTPSAEIPTHTAELVSKPEASNVSTPPQHITREISEYLAIDADVTLPAQSQYRSYTLKTVDTDADRLFDILSPEGHSALSQTQRGDHTTYRTDDGKQLSVYDFSDISYHAYDFGGEDPQQIVRNIFYYYDLAHPQAVGHDLSFLKVADMEQYGQHLLSELGVTLEPKLEKCITLSGDEILHYQQELLEEQTNSGISPALSEAADTCYLEFSFSYDGLPLLGLNEPTISTDGTWGPNPDASATVILNADGIQDFEVRYPCIPENASEPQPVLSLENAITKLAGEYEAHTHYGQTTVTNIWMEYIPMNRNGAVVLTPYWCFASIDASLKDQPGYLGNADRINAFTGENLAYGG